MKICPSGLQIRKDFDTKVECLDCPDEIWGYCSNSNWSFRKKMVVMMGLPRSGKSTYIRNKLMAFQLVCADNVRLALGRQFDEKLEPFVWATHNIMVEHALIAGRNVVIDSTNTIIDRVLRYKDLADSYRYNFQLIYVKTDIEECLRRNGWDKDNQVPVSVIERMQEQLQESLQALTTDIDKFTRLQNMKIVEGDLRKIVDPVKRIQEMRRREAVGDIL